MLTSVSVDFCEWRNGLAAIVIWLVVGAIIFRFLSLFILNKDFNIVKKEIIGTGF